MQKILALPAIAFVHYLIRQFLQNGGIINASALTYTTLFAVVPLMTVSYAMIAAIPSFQGIGEQVQGWIFSNFVPATGAVVQNYLRDFTSQAQKLTGVGIGFLIVTSVMMMRNIEVAFNRIWRVSEQRKGMASFLLYWAVLSLGPFLIGVGLFVTSYIASLPFISDATEVVGKTRLLLLLPMILSCAAFTLLYAAVPNCKVPIKNAFIGGVVVAILFEAAKRGFALFATQFPSYELIYGAFAAVPLFLVWILISWFIILMGCELTRALTVYRTDEQARLGSDFRTVLGVLYRFWQAQKAGVPLTAEQLLREVPSLDQSRWDQYVQLLLKRQLICRTEGGAFLLTRDLHDLTIYDVNRLLPWPLPNPEVLRLYPWDDVLNRQLEHVQQMQAQQLGITLDTLFSQVEKGHRLKED